MCSVGKVIFSEYKFWCGVDLDLKADANIANLNENGSLPCCCRPQSRPNMAAPWLKPKMPSNGPNSSKNVSIAFKDSWKNWLWLKAAHTLQICTIWCIHNYFHYKNKILRKLLIFSFKILVRLKNVCIYCIVCLGKTQVPVCSYYVFR